MLYGNLIIVNVAICHHMVTKRLLYDKFGLPYDINMGDPRPQCSIIGSTIGSTMGSTMGSAMGSAVESVRSTGILFSNCR